MVALSFEIPYLLIGLAAAAIPFVLHLLSSVRAQEALFPTLRFLRMSMERTARRRRIRHWLLLALRALLLAVLALGVAGPISEATGGWLAGRRSAAVVVLDNSLSMAVRKGESTCFQEARDAAGELFGLDERPSLAAMMPTTGGAAVEQLSAEPGQMIEAASGAAIHYGPPRLAQRFRKALELLRREAATPRKALYLFSDLQRNSFQELLKLSAQEGDEQVHVLVVDAAGRQPANVAVTDLEVSGPRVVDAEMEFTATVTNSSATDRKVAVALRIGQTPIGPAQTLSLRKAGQEGSIASVRFAHRFARPGAVVGEVHIDSDDDLPEDNVRRFCFEVADRVKALIVAGGEADRYLRLLLTPRDVPWPIEIERVGAERFAGERLRGMTAAFFCEVPSLTPAQADAVVGFVRDGGTAVWFLGPQVQAGSYNDLLVEKVEAEGGLLPARIGDPVGEVDPQARAFAVDWVDMRHPFFEGMYETMKKHVEAPGGVVMRYYRLAPSVRPPRVLVRLSSGEALVVEKRFGRGRAVLCTTTCSFAWGSFPVSPMLPAICKQAALLAHSREASDRAYPAGRAAEIRLALPEGRPVDRGIVYVTPPAGQVPGERETVDVPIRKVGSGHRATFAETHTPGEYRWQYVDNEGQVAASGAFVVNTHGEESDLRRVSAGPFVEALRARGFRRAYAARSLAAVHAAAEAEAKGKNWWDLLLAIAIFLLVVEAVVANRRRRGREAVPRHLNPRLAG
jgi:hypothetical protein